MDELLSKFLKRYKKTKKVILAQGQFKPYEKSFMWCGIAGKYFEELVIPNNPEIIKEGLYSSQIEVNDYANAQALLERRAFTSADIQDTYYMYFGPRSEKYLKVYNVSDIITRYSNGDWNLSNGTLTKIGDFIGFAAGVTNIGNDSFINFDRDDQSDDNNRFKIFR